MMNERHRIPPRRRDLLARAALARARGTFARAAFARAILARGAGSLALLAIALTAPLDEIAGQSVTTVSWGGSYAKAVNEAINIPFTAATGIRVNVEDYSGGLAQIRAQVDVGNIHWDVVDMEIADAVRRVRRRVVGAHRHHLFPGGTRRDTRG